jgi:hypothetical protein
MTHTTVPVTRPATVPTNSRFIVGIVVGALVSLGVVIIAVGSGAATRLAAVPLGPMESRAYAQPFDGARRASVRLQFGSGDLTVSALAPATATWPQPPSRGRPTTRRSRRIECATTSASWPTSSVTSSLACRCRWATNMPA